MRFRSISIMLPGLLFVLTICAGCTLQPIVVEGSAMLPTFADGDRVFVDRSAGQLQRGDLIVFRYPKDPAKIYFNRIVGLPGETIEIREGLVYINGERLAEPYLAEPYNQQKATFPPRKMPERQYFVLGDNRDNSSDSRYWGGVDFELITGKYYTTYLKAK